MGFDLTEIDDVTNLLDSKMTLQRKAYIYKLVKSVYFHVSLKKNNLGLFMNDILRIHCGMDNHDHETHWNDGVHAELQFVIDPTIGQVICDIFIKLQECIEHNVELASMKLAVVDCFIHSGNYTTLDMQKYYEYLLQLVVSRTIASKRQMLCAYIDGLDQSPAVRKCDVHHPDCIRNTCNCYYEMVQITRHYYDCTNETCAICSVPRLFDMDIPIHDLVSAEMYLVEVYNHTSETGSELGNEYVARLRQDILKQRTFIYKNWKTAIKKRVLESHFFDDDQVETPEIHIPSFI